MAVDVAILGPVEATVDGVPVALRGSRLRALLARLALGEGRPVGPEALASAVWDDDRPADEAHALQSLVSRLRGALGAAGAVVQAPGGYAVVLDGPTDAARFAALAREGRTAGDPADRAGLLRDALGLWRGAALGELAGTHGFARDAAARLEAERDAVLADRIAADLDLGRADGAAAELDALVAARPADEPLAALRMRALAAAGRPAAALEAYESLRAALDGRLGAVPSPALRDLHGRLLRDELAPVPADGAVAPAPPGAAPAPPAAGDGGAATPAPSPSVPAAPVTSFVGRDADVAGAGALLADHRLVTLVGPGGAGKTRMAGEVARGPAGDRARQGTFLVELAPIEDGHEIAGTMLAALGLPEVRLPDRRRPVVAVPEAVDRLAEALGAGEALVVLDNCEHVLDEVAGLADALLARCPDLRLLATSREPLRVDGERILDVGPLPVPEPGADPAEALRSPAVRLFADRAAAARSGFVVDADTVGPVVELCRRLDGLPLALELAAARSRTMPVAEIAERLGDRFRLLTGGARTRGVRQRTLRAVVDWSWDLLDEDDRRWMRRLSVFAGPLPAWAAPVVAGEEDADELATLDRLAGLAERSLLQPVDVPGGGSATTERRYRMLETLREYGADRLAEAGDADATRLAHARCYADLVARADPHLRGTEQLAWFGRLRSERDELVPAIRRLAAAGDRAAAVSTAVSGAWFWLLLARPKEVALALRAAGAVAGEPGGDPAAGDAERLDEELAAAFLRATEILDDRVRGLDELRDAMLEPFDRVMTLDRSSRPMLLPVLAVGAELLGREDDGGRLIVAARADPDPWVRGMLELFGAQQAENSGDLQGMRRHHDDALALLDEAGDEWGGAIVRVSRSGQRMPAGDLDGAQHDLDEAQRRFARFAHPDDARGREPGSSAMLEVLRSDLALRRDDVDGARALLAGVDTEASDVDDEERTFVAIAQLRLARVAGDRRAIAVARERLARDPAVATLGTDARRHRLRAVGLAAMVVADVEVGEATAETARLAVDAVTVGLASGDGPVAAGAAVGLAAHLVASGRATEAARVLGAAERARGAEDATSTEVRWVRGRVEAALGAGATAAAVAEGRERPRDEALALLRPEAWDLAPADPAAG